MLTLFEQALIMHLIGDWILQNNWMAVNKSSLRHPAALVHTAIHMALQTIALGWLAGVVLGLCHMLIDTRALFRWWRDFFGMTKTGPVALHVSIWTDQVLHIMCIAAWIQFAAPRL